MHGNCNLFMRLFMLLALLIVAPGRPAAEDAAAPYPSRPVKIIVPFAPGGGLDVSVRLLAKYAEVKLGQNIEVVNITKGGNLAGHMEGIRAEPDGYTVLAWASGLVTDELTIKNATYTHKDIAPLCMFADDPEVIVVAADFARDHAIDSLDDLFDHVRDNPGAVTIGMGGNWTSHDFLRLKMESQAGVKFNRMPFLGGAPALAATATGNCNIALPFVSELLGLRERDKVKPLAVAYGSRAVQLPDVPTVAECGYPEMTQSTWRVLTLPKGASDRVVETLEQAFREAMEDPEFIGEAAKLGINPVFMGSKELAAFLEQERAFYLEKTQRLGIRVEREE